MLFWTLKINQPMNLHGTTAAASALSQYVLHMQQVRQGGAAGVKIYTSLYLLICSLFSFYDYKRHSH